MCVGVSECVCVWVFVCMFDVSLQFCLVLSKSMVVNLLLFSGSVFTWCSLASLLLFYTFFPTVCLPVVDGAFFARLVDSSSMRDFAAIAIFVSFPSIERRLEGTT